MRLFAVGYQALLPGKGPPRIAGRGAVLVALCVALMLGGCSASSEPIASGTGSPTGAAGVSATPSSAASTSPSSKKESSSTVGTSTRIAFVNVGQGDAILIKSGSADVLVDGGPEGSDTAVVAAMRTLRMRELDTVVVSHAHADHVGATDELCAVYDPERVLLVGKCDGELKRAARSTGAKLVQVRRGATYRWGAVKAKVLSPESISGDANADSLVLLLEVAGRRFLLTGDLAGPNEATVGAICARGPPLYLLKVAHHGSRHSTSSSFLANTDPKFAVITVGANSYGHPTPEAVSRLRTSGARVYTTQRNGTISLRVSASGSVKWQFSKTSKPVAKVTSAGSGRSTSSGAARSTAGASTRVYATSTGECYHRSSCRYLSKSKIPITLKDAKARGYRPCSVCGPAS